jgi:hypothetical protein
MHRLALVALLAALLASTAGAATKPQAPRTGTIVPGTSFGGLALGLTKAQVRAAWGSHFGVCDNCPQVTWYYTFVKFEPKGIGVRFLNGRVASYFTVGEPFGWKTSKGLALGDPRIRTEKLYGTAPVLDCAGYSLYEILVKKQLLLVYLSDDRVYGLGLATRSFNPCG